MKLTKLAIIAVTIAVASITGCDEAAMVEDLIGDHSVEGIGTLAELKQIEGESAAPPTNPVNLEEILNFPGEDATEEEIKEWHEMVVAASVNVNVLDITGCTPNPLVIEVGYGEAIEVKNRGTTDHILHYGEATMNIPAGGSRGIVASEFGVKGGSKGGDRLAGYGCDGPTAGIFYVNSKLQKHIYFRVVQFLFPDGEGGPGIEGVKITPLAGSAEGEKETLPDGIISLRGDFPLTVRLEKEGFVTEVTVTKDGETIVLPIEQNISFRVVEPLLLDKNGPGIKGVTVTCLEGSDEGIKETDQDGKVSFFGIPPLIVRIKKEGYITTETMVGKGSEIVFPNEWPEGANEAIRQLGLTEMIVSGELILRWGEDEYLPALSKELARQPGEDGLGAVIKSSCSPNRVIIVVRKWRSRESMVGGVVHELMHARQGYDSNPPLCGDWTISKEGKAWIAATEKDLKEIGPIPDFDDQIYGVSGILLGEFPSENQAMFYSRWYMGPGEGGLIEALWGDRERDLKMLYELAPNRCQYLADRFGPPPPR